MQARLLVTALVLALLVVGPAPAATFTVSITKDGFVPDALTVGVGDTVTWTNADTSSHQVESKSAGFTSPLLAPGASFSFTYSKPGRFSYQDKVVKRLKGTVTVQQPTEAASLTLAASPTLVVYGASVTLSGAVSSKRGGETVTVFAQPYGQTAFVAVGSAITGSDGRWSYLVKPRLRTLYEARWKPSTQGAPATSPQAAIRVRPQVGFRVRATSGRVVTFFTKVRGARSFAGRFVYFQRRSALGQWVSRKKVTLTSTSSATFEVRLPDGRSRVRVFMPAAQAGPGYVAGISRTLGVSR
jgi:plastocyanin